MNQKQEKEDVYVAEIIDNVSFKNKKNNFENKKKEKEMRQKEKELLIVRELDKYATAIVENINKFEIETENNTHYFLYGSLDICPNLRKYYTNSVELRFITKKVNTLLKNIENYPEVISIEYCSYGIVTPSILIIMLKPKSNNCCIL